MRHVAIDIETLSTRQDAVVASIAAVEFEHDAIGESYFWRLDWRAQTDTRHVDPGTVAWWATQAPDTIAKTFKGPTVDAWDALDGLRDLCAQAWVWGDPPTFDLGILKHFAQQLNLPDLWSHRNERCARTVCALAGGGRERAAVPHDPESDALAMALDVIRKWRWT
jgi:hypothetical protein